MRSIVSWNEISSRCVKVRSDPAGIERHVDGDLLAGRQAARRPGTRAGQRERPVDGRAGVDVDAANVGDQERAGTEQVREVERGLCGRTDDLDRRRDRDGLGRHTEHGDTRGTARARQHHGLIEALTGVGRDLELRGVQAGAARRALDEYGRRIAVLDRQDRAVAVGRIGIARDRHLEVAVEIVGLQKQLADVIELGFVMPSAIAVPSPTTTVVKSSRFVDGTRVDAGAFSQTASRSTSGSPVFFVSVACNRHRARPSGSPAAHVYATACCAMPASANGVPPAIENPTPGSHARSAATLTL